MVSVVLEDGTLHSASIHYSHSENPFRIFMQTANTTIKAQPFLNGQTGKGSFVIGFSEEEWLTLQMHGSIRSVTDPNELEEIYKIHYGKFPEVEKYKGSETVTLEFVPQWWRYTDFNIVPPTIITE